GGPAGLEAAWVAAARGHEVILLERGPRLGGKIPLAASLPGREEIADLAAWRVGECARRGVEVRLGSDATEYGVLALEPGAVIVATGGRAVRDLPTKSHPLPVRGGEQAHVLDHEEALRRWQSLGQRVLILDAVGFIEAIGLGELLAASGRETSVVTPLASPMVLDRETASYALARAVQAGLRWRPNTALVAVGPGEATVMDVLSRRTEQVAADHVVIRTHGLPCDELYFALRGRVPELIRVGDAVAVRPADRAIFDGHLAGRQV
ncbi:MAG: hypothetical protein FJ148_08735, partial [Deltaproteobacteria bacterium]|nr:hypothetical protein [Deltaproteobacteria bacterium]